MEKGVGRKTKGNKDNALYAVSVAFFSVFQSASVFFMMENNGGMFLFEERSNVF